MQAQHADKDRLAALLKSLFLSAISKNIAIFKTNLLATFNYITVLADDELTESDIENAENFTQQIDMDDTIFIAFALALNSLLWTGDRKLLNGVKRKGFTNIISTKELKDIIKGL